MTRARHQQPRPPTPARPPRRSGAALKGGPGGSTRALFAAAGLLAVLGGWLLLGGRGSARPDSPQERAHPPPASAAIQRPSVAPPAQRPAAEPSPSATARSTGRPSAAADAPRPTAAPPSSPDVDELAGDLTDQQMQHLLEQASPTNVPASVAAAALATGWQQLQADLTAGRWTRLHQQAAVARATRAGDPTPTAVDVTILWSGTSPAGELAQRRRNVVRLSAARGPWRVTTIS